MGLLYLFPDNENDELYAKASSKGLFLSTYGLPGIFWIYMLMAFVTLGFLTLAIWSSLIKVLQGADVINFWIGTAVALLIGFLPIITLGFFFYRKELFKHQKELKITHRVFGLRFFQKNYHLDSKNPFSVDHQLDSPNMAKIESDPSMKGFQNKGYFYLKGYTNEGKEFVVDRHSRKIDLVKLKERLEMH